MKLTKSKMKSLIFSSCLLLTGVSLSAHAVLTKKSVSAAGYWGDVLMPNNNSILYILRQIRTHSGRNLHRFRLKSASFPLRFGNIERLPKFPYKRKYQ
ncbi:hypothetical protein [Catenovulum maritimum]|uniref:hypothetical protein n=1 Tax=Catenovulum maritimum TaxID=1513271 RepID=UPI00122E2B25|nr:hypothetical protein [Catenovulum maritimum]